MMDSDIEELESLFSEHFGCTPHSTPACSQENEEFIEDYEEHLVERDDIESAVRERVDQFIAYTVDEGGSESDACELNDEHLDIESEYDQCTDDDDEKKVKKFIRDGCGCQRNCSSQYCFSDIYEHILNVREMSKDEKEMYLIGTLGHGADQEMTKRGKKRKRSRTTYQYHGKTICRHACMLIYDIGKHALASIVSHAKSGQQQPRRHGNRGKAPKHAIKYEEVLRVVEFLQNYADTYGLPQPAAPRGGDDIPPIYLSSDKTKKQLHKEYTDICEQSNVRALKKTSFFLIWSNCLGHIRIASPKADVCATCDGHRKKIMNAVQEQDKLDATNAFRNHIEIAQKERLVYNDCIKRAKESYQEDPGTRYNHYTFDFSQSVSIPHFSRQIGPMYFTCLRKVHIFGVRIDGQPKQLNFLIDENETIGKDGAQTKGPNAVLSMLHHVLEIYGKEEKHISLHADNCPGQNKNRFVIGYFVWRVVTGRNESVEYLMQMPGHARCLVDGGFGQLKKLYRRSNLETLDDLDRVTGASSATNEAVRYPAWQWRDWKTFLGQMFKPVTGISKYQYFKVTNEHPYEVLMRTSDDKVGVTVDMLKRGAVVTGELPPIIQPAGLSRQRQDYLFNTVRPFISPENRDATCPQHQ